MNFLNKIDRNSDIIFDKDNVNFLLWLNDSEYEDLANRTSILKDKNVSFKELIYNTNDYLSVEVVLTPENKIELFIYTEDYKKYRIELSKGEITSLHEEIEKVLKEEFNITVEESFNYYEV